MARKSLTGLVVLLVVWVARPAFGGVPVTPGTIIFDMDTHTEYCDPDYWSFFGYPTTDFGSNGWLSEDGHAAFTTGNWAWCDLVYGAPWKCRFLGSKHGAGRMCCGQPLCGGLGSGVRDADLDVSQGTGFTVRVLLYMPDPVNDKPGVRYQFELVDSNGHKVAPPGENEIPELDTRACVPNRIEDRPWVNRAPPLADDGQWHTYTFWIIGLDDFYSGSSVPGDNPLLLPAICGIYGIYRRGETSAGRNTVVFDEMTLIDDPPVLWADADADGDVDLRDFAEFQRCFNADPEVDTACARMDANYDSVIPDGIPENNVVNLDDYLNFNDCHLGPEVTSGFYPWCY